MTTPPFVSYAQNHEDVVLHRALRDVTNGRYLDVGANDPVLDSVTKAFYDAGWRGLSVEPVPTYAREHEKQRPGDIVVQAAATDAEVDSITLYAVPDTGLSSLRKEITDAHAGTGRGTAEPIEVPARRLDAILDEAGWEGSDIHFLSLDVEGAEDQVLRSVDLRRYRPWIIVVEALEPDTALPSHQRWEHLLLDADYRFGLFDGLSRFYLAAERAAELGDRLLAPANVLDNYIRAHTLEVSEEAATLRNDVFNLTNERDRLTADATAATEAQQAELAWRGEQVSNFQQQVADLQTAIDGEQLESTGLRDQIAGLQAELAAATAHANAEAQAAVTWRAKAVGAWADSSAAADASAGLQAELDHLRQHAGALEAELAAVKGSMSWRVTKPLRAARSIRVVR